MRLDWVFDGYDLVTTDTLETAVLISLMTDRLANADDEIPDGSNDRRGVWSDMAVPLTEAPPAGDLIGSRLWLLSRRKVEERTRLDAITYCLEALQWMIDDGVAMSVDVDAAWNEQTLGRLDIAIQIGATGSDGKQVSTAYRLAWSASLGVPLVWN